MDTLVDFIVPTWNGANLVRSFVDSLTKSTGARIRIIIVDNGSTDDTVPFVKSIKNDANRSLLLIQNAQNEGYIKATNQGLLRSDAPFACFANNDLIFSPGWLEEVLQIMERYPKVGVLNPNSNNLGTNLPKDRSLEDFSAELRKKWSGVFVEMAFCIGFCMVIRREVINALGGFSEEFCPMFFEDTDFSVRAAKAGYMIGVAKGAYVYHNEHSSISRLSESKKESIFAQSKKKFEEIHGRILRIAFIARNRAELETASKPILDCLRQGNIVHLYTTRSFPADSALAPDWVRDIGIQYFTPKSTFSVFTKILVKKKKYDLIISDSVLMRGIFSLFRKRSAKTITKEKILELRFRDKTRC